MNSFQLFLRPSASSHSLSCDPCPGLFVASGECTWVNGIFATLLGLEVSKEWDLALVPRQGQRSGGHLGWLVLAGSACVLPKLPAHAQGRRGRTVNYCPEITNLPSNKWGNMDTNRQIGVCFRIECFSIHISEGQNG